MRVVLDTNIIVSALIAPAGKPAARRRSDSVGHREFNPHLLNLRRGESVPALQRELANGS